MPLPVFLTFINLFIILFSFIFLSFFIAFNLFDFFIIDLSFLKTNKNRLCPLADRADFFTNKFYLRGNCRFQLVDNGFFGFLVEQVHSVRIQSNSQVLVALLCSRPWVNTSSQRSTLAIQIQKFSAPIISVMSTSHSMTPVVAEDRNISSSWIASGRIPRITSLST